MSEDVGLNEQQLRVYEIQGMSLDATHVDVEQWFESGQAYVALSRLRSLAGFTLARPIPLQIPEPRVLRGEGYCIVPQHLHAGSINSGANN